MNSLLEFTYVELKLFLRTFVSVFFALVFPAMLLLIFGGIYGNKPEAIFHGYGTVDVSFPAYTALIIAVTGLMSLPLAVSNYREKKILKRLKATPINPLLILVSQVIVNFFMTVIGMGILYGVGRVVFHLHFLGNFGDMAAAFVLSTFSIYSIGFLIASIAPNQKFATALANIVYFPMLFLTGATFPLQLMPSIMVKISKALPLTYVVNLLKNIWLGQSFAHSETDVIVLGGILIVAAAVSLKTFRWE